VEVLVEHLGAVQFEIKARQHTIVCDQPPDNFGHDEGMTQPELLLGSLGACAAFYAVAYLRKHKLAEKGVTVRVTAEKKKDPARLDDFRITIDCPAGLDSRHVAGVEDAVHHCLIHNTLLQPSSIAIEIHTPAAEEAVSLEM